MTTQLAGAGVEVLDVRNKEKLTPEQLVKELKPSNSAEILALIAERRKTELL